MSDWGMPVRLVSVPTNRKSAPYAKNVYPRPKTYELIRSSLTSVIPIRGFTTSQVGAVTGFLRNSIRPDFPDVRIVLVPAALTEYRSSIDIGG